MFEAFQRKKKVIHIKATNQLQLAKRVTDEGSDELAQVCNLARTFC